MPLKRTCKFLCALCSLMMLIAACTTTPTPSAIQQTATALQAVVGAQNALATQQTIFLTSQAFTGQQPFMIITPFSSVPIATLPSPATLQALTAQPCVFQWVTQDLPAITRDAQSAFARVPTLADVSVRAQAYAIRATPVSLVLHC